MQDPAVVAAVKCPRCESSNTKFSYYNNYKLSQPRHLCKDCRRFWTKGGALRNVPVGGGTHKKPKCFATFSASPNNPKCLSTSAPSDSPIAAPLQEAKIESSSAAYPVIDMDEDPTDDWLNYLNLQED